MWFINNLGTIVVALIVLAVTGFVIYTMIRDKKKGKSSCGCNCGSCPSACSCHKS
jgi:hypothetical protein